MSGIMIRHQVKPSVLQIHKYNPIYEPEALKGTSVPTPTQGVSESQTSRRRSQAYRHSQARMSGKCSISTKICKFSSTNTVSKATLMSMDRSVSTLSMTSLESTFFCDWFPILFGVDEDVIPMPEEEDYSDMDLMGEDAGDVEVERKPRYGRRARPKPVLTRKDGEKFECICDIDLNYDRTYVSHFGGGRYSQRDDWRIPHFSSFWDEYREAQAAIEDASVMKLIETKEVEEQEEKAPPERKFLFTQQKVQDLRKGILKSLRPLTCRELRRYRMAFSEALILEMEEDGYLESAAFFKALLIEEYHLDQTREKCPTLRESKSKLQKLSKLLMAVERKGRKQEFNNQSIILLKTGKYFSDMEPHWWWLAERLFGKAVEVSSKYFIDGGKAEAIARYIFGRFLLENVGKVHAAQEHLTRAKELSNGREWHANKILHKREEAINKECSNYLCRALVETSRELRAKGQPEKALQFIHLSYKICQESETSRKDIELETLFELGMTYQEMGELEWAKVAFKKFTAKAKLEGYHKSVCDGHLELAICYRMEGEINHCHFHLKSYLDFAHASADENLVAFGNRYLGEFHLNHGYSEKAVKFFEESFESFLDQLNEASSMHYSDMLPENLTLPHDVEMVRILTGLAKGEILTKPICRLILRARDVRNQNDTLKLLKWKNSQEITFSINEEGEEEEDRENSPEKQDSLDSYGAPEPFEVRDSYIEVNVNPEQEHAEENPGDEAHST